MLTTVIWGLLLFLSYRPEVLMQDLFPVVEHQYQLDLDYQRDILEY